LDGYFVKHLGTTDGLKTEGNAKNVSYLRVDGAAQNFHVYETGRREVGREEGKRTGQTPGKKKKKKRCFL